MPLLLSACCSSSNRRTLSLFTGSVVVENLSEYYAVEGGGEQVRPNDHPVSGLLHGREDSGDAADELKAD